MKTPPTRRRRGAAARRVLRVAAAAAFAAVGSSAALAQEAAPPPAKRTPEPKLPTRLAKSQPQKAVADAIDKHRPDWKRFQADLPGGKRIDNYDYDYQPIAKHERFRSLRGLEKVNDFEVQRALAQMSGEIYGTLPIARARIEDQTYRNLANLLRPDGVFAGAGVAPVIAAPVPAAPRGPAYAVAPYSNAPVAGGIVFDGAVAGPSVGGVYGPGFGPGTAAGGLDVAPPAPTVNYGPDYGPTYDQGFRPVPDRTFNGGNYGPNYGTHNDRPNYGGGPINGTVVTPGGPAAPAGTPVPRGSYLTPDGRLLDAAGNSLNLNGDGGNYGRPDVQRAPAPAPLGPTGQPLDGPGMNGRGMNGPGMNGRGMNPGFDGPGLNAPGMNDGADGGGTAIPPGSTFGPNGEVLGPTGAVLRPGRPNVTPASGVMPASHTAPAYGGHYGGPAYGGHYGGHYGGNYGGTYGGGFIAPQGPCASGQCGPAPIAPITPVYQPAPVVAAPVAAVGVGPAVAPVGGLWGGWVSGYYLNGDLDGTDHRAGLDYDGGGVNVGLTRQVSETLLVGAFFGYAGISGEATAFDLGTYDVDTWQFGAYTRKLLGNFYLIGAGSFGVDDYSVSRNLDYNFIQRPNTRAAFQGNTASVFGELGYTKAITCSHFIQPFASLQYTYVVRGGFHESGKYGKDRFNDYYDPTHPSGESPKKFAKGEDPYGSNLTVGQTRDDFLRFRVGGRYFRRLRNCAGTFRVLPEIRAYYTHQEYDPSSYKVRMNDMYDCPFTVAGLHDVRDAGVLGTGVTFAHCGGTSLFGNVDGIFADRDRAVALTAGGQYVW